MSLSSGNSDRTQDQDVAGMSMILATRMRTRDSLLRWGWMLGSLLGWTSRTKLRGKKKKKCNGYTDLFHSHLAIESRFSPTQCQTSTTSRLNSATTREKWRLILSSSTNLSATSTVTTKYSNCGNTSSMTRNNLQPID